MKIASLALVAIAASALVACSDPDNARHALEGAGYSDIEMGGWEPLWCGQDDDFTTTFTAKAPNGAKVSGAVCSGLMNGATIRF